MCNLIGSERKVCIIDVDVQRILFSLKIQTCLSKPSRPNSYLRHISR